ncbi:MAG: protein kinase [Gemmatimonadales bacterium]
MAEPLPRLSAALADRYRIERELGAGGMATVYLAQDLRHNRKVAVKVLRPELSAVLGGERFLKEIEVTANLQHPHILPLFDSGACHPERSEGFQQGEGPAAFLYYVMPYVEGETLRARMTREKMLPVGEAVRIARETASALDYAHRRGVIHRDIKPENILLQEGAVMLADFGIALAVREAGGDRLTQTGLSLGTPQYMSPEQATGEREVDARSDLYSLGAVTYEMLAGEPPVTGTSARAIIAKLLTERPTSLRVVRDAVPPEVDAAVLRALAKEPSDRFASAREFSDALDDRASAQVVSPAAASVSAARASAAMAPGAVDGVPPRAPRSAMLLVAGIAVVLVIAGGWWLSRRGVTVPPSSAPGVRTIAVLPFAERNTEGGEFLGDGMAETLIFALGKVPGFKVAAQTSSFTFKGKEADLKAIGDKLGVATVLTGSLQRVGTHLRVTVRLENVADHSEVWTEQYDREVKDVFKLQDDIAHEVVNRLQASAGGNGRGGSTGTLVNTGTANVEAYSAYLQGRVFWGQRGEGIRKGLAYFERAVALDPNYALAWTGVADSYSLLSGYGDIPAREAMPKAKQAAERALALDSTLAAAHAAMAFIHEVYDYDWDGAEREYRNAIRLDSTYVVGRYWYGMYLNVVAGRNEEAEVQNRAAVALDPLSPHAANLLSQMLPFVRKFDDAIAESRRAIALAPTWTNYRTLALALRRAGRVAEAIAVLDSAVTISKHHPWILAPLVVTAAQSGDMSKARGVYQELLAAANAGHAQPQLVAMASSWVAPPAETVRWLERARDERDGTLGFPRQGGYAPTILKDPQFVAFWTKFGITPVPGGEPKK